MSKQFFSSLSQNYIEILKDDEYYDITIEVGEDPNVKIFRAHMIILCYRSPFLRRTLASNKKNDSHVLAHIKLSNISPETFQIILKYIYGGIISLNKQEPSETSKILFFSLSSDEFVQKIRPYKKLLNDQLYEELICSYLDSNSKPNDNILLPRYGNIDGIIDSKIVNLNIIALISR
ncbi:BTB/POZ protein [Rhizophagus irregularis DAOM 181602=DAOM 197198]|nr:BTB/POZ protein [Rhizophagus irregularis DAOM 181602=DAOM 197198]